MQSYSKASNSATTQSKFIKTSDWDVQSNRYMQPRTSDRGIKMVSIISNQRNKKLHLQLPVMACWGIEDFTDRETGESDGKFKIKLHFRDDSSEESQEALKKLQAFENQIISDAVSNSEAWFGKKLSRELAEDRYFPFLKVGKNKETKEPDPTRGHYFSPKVNCYTGKWDLEIFDQNKTMLFPSENEGETPIDFVPSGSEVTCGLECKYIWLGAKGWGVSWALKQVVVTPKYSDSVSGKLQLDVIAEAGGADTEETKAPSTKIKEAEVVVAAPAPAPAVVQETYAEDSDEETPPVKQVVVVAEEEPVAEEAKPEEVVAPKVVAKKMVQKKIQVAPTPATLAVPEEVVVAVVPEVPPVPPAAAVKKTVVRKK